MFLVPLALAIGVTIGLLSGGTVDQVRGLRVRFWPVVVLSVVLSALIGGEWGSELPWAAGFLAASLLSVGAACMLNLHLTGSGIVLLGVALNLVALMLNGHIAVDPDAVIGAGIVSADDLVFVELGAGRAYQDADTILPILGAVVPVRVVGEVLSFGDLIVIAGLANVGFRIPRPPGLGRVRVRVDTKRAAARPTPQVIDLTDHNDLSQIPPRPVTTITGEADHPPRVDT